MEQFDRLGPAYHTFIRKDPMRRLHYETVIGLLHPEGSAIRKRILDIGCGEGELPRKLASDPYHDNITGFDSAPSLLKQAKDQEEQSALGIRYITAAADAFRSEEAFSDAVSVMVLPYSPSADYLHDFFSCAQRSLVPDGRFISIIFNPNFTAFERKIGNRRFAERDGKVEVQFLDPETNITAFTSMLTQYTKAEYERAALESGFGRTLWRDLHPSAAMRQMYAADFWEAFEREQPYTLLIAQK